MEHPTDEAIRGQLVAIISDGFNRSLGALEQAGAIETKKLRQQYKGVGSKFYDLVTEQIVLTAKYGTPGMRQLFIQDKADTSKPGSGT